MCALRGGGTPPFSHSLQTNKVGNHPPEAGHGEGARTISLALIGCERRCLIVCALTMGHMGRRFLPPNLKIFVMFSSFLAPRVSFGERK